MSTPSIAMEITPATGARLLIEKWSSIAEEAQAVHARWSALGKGIGIGTKVSLAAMGIAASAGQLQINGVPIGLDNLKDLAQIAALALSAATAGGAIGVVLHAGREKLRQLSSVPQDATAEEALIKRLLEMNVTVVDQDALAWTDGKAFMIVRGGPNGIVSEAVNKATFEAFQTQRALDGSALTVIYVRDDGFKVQRSVGGLLQQGPDGEPSVQTVRTDHPAGPWIDRKWHDRGCEVAPPLMGATLAVDAIPSPGMAHNPGK